MEIINSAEFKNKVEEIVSQILLEHEDRVQKLKEEVEHVQSAYNQTYLSLLQYLKSGFESLKDQLFEDIQVQRLQQITPHPLKTEEPKQLNALSLRMYELEKEMSDKMESVNKKIESVSLNKDEIIEQIKALEGRVESQWQGLAFLGDQIQSMQNSGKIQSSQKKKFSFF